MAASFGLLGAAPGEEPGAGKQKPAGENSRPGTRVPGLLAIYFTWLQAGRLK
jgi:hypothetical protein